MSQTKEQILLTALELFSQRGFDAVSVSDIAGKLGITKGALYKHYQSKRDIFDHIVRRMSELDLEQAQAYGMPEGTLEETADAYRDVPLEKIRVYTKAMFLHWTAEPFSADFRRLLTLEQYRDPGMARLYQQYLASGPLDYMTDVFLSVAGSEAAARQLALAFYGPMFLLYSVYDAAGDTDAALTALDRHIDRFAAQLAAENGKI